jgi:hypothetical protein
VEVKGVPAKSATLCEDATAYFPPRYAWSKTMGYCWRILE